MITVADSGPIHYLILIGEADLLRAFYGSIHLPLAVVRELSSLGAPDPVAEWMANAPEWILVALEKKIE